MCTCHGLHRGFSNTAMNEVLQLIIVFSGIGRFKIRTCHTIGHGFQRQNISSSYAFRNIWIKKWLPFTKKDTCTILPEVFIHIFILFFFLYKSCNLLNNAWDSHTIGQFWDLVQIILKSYNIAAFITTDTCRTKTCITIYCILNNGNINYIHVYLVGRWKCHVTSTTHLDKVI